MRVNKFAILIGMLLFVAIAIPASASSSQPIRIYVDGNQVSFPDQQPYLDQNSRTLVPVRFISEALGAEVKWDDKKQEVTVKDEAVPSTIKLWIGKKNYTVNGQTKTMDTEAVLTKQYRTMVPMRFISEGLGLKVDYKQVEGVGLVFNFSRNYPEEKIKETIDKIVSEVEKELTDSTIIPDNQWSYNKPVVGSGSANYFSDKNVKIAYATVDQLPIKTDHYTVKKIELTPTHIVISYDTPEKATPELYITKGNYLWVRGSYLSGKTSIDYKYPIEAYGNDDNPLTYNKLKTVDYLNICFPGYILAIENPWKGDK